MEAEIISITIKCILELDSPHDKFSLGPKGFHCRCFSLFIYPRSFVVISLNAFPLASQDDDDDDDSDDQSLLTLADTTCAAAADVASRSLHRVLETLTAASRYR